MMPDNVNSVREALKQAQWLYDELSLSPLEAAAKYGPDYEPATDEECLEVRRMIDTAIPLVEKIARQQLEEDCKLICPYCLGFKTYKTASKINAAGLYVHYGEKRSSDGVRLSANCGADPLRRAWKERENA